MIAKLSNYKLASINKGFSTKLNCYINIYRFFSSTIYYFSSFNLSSSSIGKNPHNIFPHSITYYFASFIFLSKLFISIFSKLYFYYSHGYYTPEAIQYIKFLYFNKMDENDLMLH